MIGFASQWWLRTRRPGWFKKYNYLLSAALDGGSQVIIFILVRQFFTVAPVTKFLSNSHAPVTVLRCVRRERQCGRLPLLVG